MGLTLLLVVMLGVAVVATVLIPRLVHRRPAKPIDVLAEMRESRKRYVAMEHEAMEAWEALCDCPSFEMQMKRETERMKAEYVSPARAINPMLYDGSVSYGGIMPQSPFQQYMNGPYEAYVRLNQPPPGPMDQPHPFFHCQHPMTANRRCYRPVTNPSRAPFTRMR